MRARRRGTSLLAGGRSGLSRRAPEQRGSSRLATLVATTHHLASACPRACPSQIYALPAFDYSRWVWLATLAGATWQGYSAEWLVGAFALTAAWRVLSAVKSGVSASDAPAIGCVAVAAWAVYDKAVPTLALFILAAHVAACALKAADSLLS